MRSANPVVYELLAKTLKAISSGNIQKISQSSNLSEKDLKHIIEVLVCRKLVEKTNASEDYFISSKGVRMLRRLNFRRKKSRRSSSRIQGRSKENGALPCP